MIQIEEVTASSKTMAEDFLKSIPSIENIDEEILNNAVLALDDDKIVGCISFEKFSEKGLIRYFVFKKVLSTDYLEQLLSRLEEKAKKNGIEMLVCIAECSQIEELFQSLSFQKLENKKIFLNEEKIENTSFHRARFLNKVLE